VIKGAKKAESWWRKWYDIEKVTVNPHRKCLKEGNYWFDMEFKQY